MIFDRAAGLDAIPHVRHGFFGREGGVSEGPFASLNVSLRNADKREHAIENRRRVARVFGKAAEDLVIARQVHGTDCVIVDRPPGLSATVEADGLVTATADLILGVTSADCAPVLFADREARIVGAAHAGWRGALAGITGSTIATMLQVGAARERIVAIIGPCIAVASYEVGDELESAFLADDPANERFFNGHAPARHFDLRAYLGERLRREGIADIGHVVLDTYAETERFFSFRRTTHEGGGPFGLQVSAIAISTSADPD
ncbi:MAG: peptidoglycan editing factor PgeF [Geminicoccaceae bacterium]|nr:peptidoglycan editing factor PgeF [Geminicoccaceae bacterium]